MLNFFEASRELMSWIGAAAVFFHRDPPVAHRGPHLALSSVSLLFRPCLGEQEINAAYGLRLSTHRSVHAIQRLS